MSFDRGVGQPEIRRFIFSKSVSYGEILRVVTERFAVSHTEFKIQYNDDDDDLVEISSDQELKAAVASCNSTLRVVLAPRQRDFEPQIISAVIVPNHINDAAEMNDSLQAVNAKSPTCPESQHISESVMTESPQVMDDLTFAQKLQLEENSRMSLNKSELETPQDQEAADLEYARMLQAQEDSAGDKKATIIGAAILGAGVGLLAGGAMMAVAGASIGAVTASESGRRKVGEVAVSTGRAASDAGRRIAEATEQHREQARATASRLVSQAAEARARADAVARDALAHAREVQLNGPNQTPLNATFERVTSAAGTTLARFRATWGRRAAAASQQNDHQEAPAANGAERPAGAAAPDV